MCRERLPLTQLSSNKRTVAWLLPTVCHPVPQGQRADRTDPPRLLGMTRVLGEVSDTLWGLGEVPLLQVFKHVWSACCIPGRPPSWNHQNDLREVESTIVLLPGKQIEVQWG